MTPVAVEFIVALAAVAGASYLLYFQPRWYDTYLVEDREFSHEGAARDYIASFTDDVPRRIIRRRRFQWRSAR